MLLYDYSMHIIALCYVLLPAYVDTTTPIIITTYPYERYQIATYSLAALLVMALIGLALVTIALTRSRGGPTKRAGYY